MIYIVACNQAALCSSSGGTRILLNSETVCEK